MGMIVSLGLIHSMGLKFLTHSLLHMHAHPLPQGSTNPALETTLYNQNKVGEAGLLVVRKQLILVC